MKKKIKKYLTKVKKYAKLNLQGFTAKDLVHGIIIPSIVLNLILYIIF